MNSYSEQVLAMQGLGAVLMQKAGDIQYPVAYSGCTFNAAEQNYSSSEKECLGIVWAVQKFQAYLYDLPNATSTITTLNDLSNVTAEQFDPIGFSMPITTSRDTGLSLSVYSSRVESSTKHMLVSSSDKTPPVNSVIKKGVFQLSPIVEHMMNTSVNTIRDEIFKTATEISNRVNHIHHRTSAAIPLTITPLKDLSNIPPSVKNQQSTITSLATNANLPHVSSSSYTSGIGDIFSSTSANVTNQHNRISTQTTNVTNQQNRISTQTTNVTNQQNIISTQTANGTNQQEETMSLDANSLRASKQSDTPLFSKSRLLLTSSPTIALNVSIKGNLTTRHFEETSFLSSADKFDVFPIDKASVLQEGIEGNIAPVDDNQTLDYSISEVNATDHVSINMTHFNETVSQMLSLITSPWVRRGTTEPPVKQATSSEINSTKQSYTTNIFFSKMLTIHNGDQNQHTWNARNNMTTFNHTEKSKIKSQLLDDRPPEQIVNTDSFSEILLSTNAENYVKLQTLVQATQRRSPSDNAFLNPYTSNSYPTISEIDVSNKSLSLTLSMKNTSATMHTTPVNAIVSISQKSVLERINSTSNTTHISSTSTIQMNTRLHRMTQASITQTTRGNTGIHSKDEKAILRPVSFVFNVIQTTPVLSQRKWLEQMLTLQTHTKPTASSELMTTPTDMSLLTSWLTPYKKTPSSHLIKTQSGTTSLTIQGPTTNNPIHKTAHLPTITNQLAESQTGITLQKQIKPNQVDTRKQQPETTADKTTERQFTPVSIAATHSWREPKSIIITQRLQESNKNNTLQDMRESAPVTTPQPLLKPISSFIPQPLLKPISTVTPRPLLKPISTVTPQPLLKPISTVTPQSLLKPISSFTLESLQEPISAFTLQSLQEPFSTFTLQSLPEPISAVTPQLLTAPILAFTPQPLPEPISTAPPHLLRSKLPDITDPRQSSPMTRIIKQPVKEFISGQTTQHLSESIPTITTTGVPEPVLDPFGFVVKDFNGVDYNDSEGRQNYDNLTKDKVVVSTRATTTTTKRTTTTTKKPAEVIIIAPNVTADLGMSPTNNLKITCHAIQAWGWTYMSLSRYEGSGHAADALEFLGGVYMMDEFPFIPIDSRMSHHRVHRDSDRVSLTLESQYAVCEDEGTYLCEILVNGSVWSKTFNVDIRKKPDAPILKVPEDIIAGEEVTFTTVWNAGYPLTGTISQEVTKGFTKLPHYVYNERTSTRVQKCEVILENSYTVRPDITWNGTEIQVFILPHHNTTAKGLESLTVLDKKSVTLSILRNNTCTGHENMILPHPYTCRKYINCNNGVIKVEHCPEKKCFHRLQLACY